MTDTAVHDCAIPDDYVPEDWYKAACVCILPHGSRRQHVIFGPTEIAPEHMRIRGPASPLGPCTCECHS